MNKEQKDDTQMSNLLGKAFIRLPRKILNMSICPVKRERCLAQMYITLVTRAFYTDGFVTLNRHKCVCRRGEFVGTYQELSNLTGISRGSIGYFLKLLEEMHLIVINVITGGTRIGINGYDYFSGYEVKTNKLPGNTKAVPTMAELEKRFKGGRSMQDLDEK